MASQMYQKEVYLPIFTKVLLLGDLFAVSMEDVCIHKERYGFQRLSFLEKKREKGVVDFMKNSIDLEAQVFMETPIGRLEGIFKEDDESIFFSLPVEEKNYTHILGSYTVYLDQNDRPARQKIRCFLTKEKDTIASFDFGGNVLFGLYQGYLASQKPYQNMVVKEQEDWIIYRYQKRGTNGSFAVDIQEITDKEHSCFPRKFYAHPASTSFRTSFQEQLQFSSIDLYQNFVSACFQDYDDAFVEQMTGVKRCSLQRNAKLLAKLRR